MKPTLRSGTGGFQFSIFLLPGVSHCSHPAGIMCSLFNGEVNNHLELRRELTSIRTDWNWRGHSYAEILLAGFDTWGVEATLQKAVGMFAIALWNRETRILTLARDRVGEKPLYYGWVGSAMVLGAKCPIRPLPIPPLGLIVRFLSSA